MRTPDYFDRYDADELTDTTRGPPKCKRCGSMNVRWRQQGGRWVLFSSTPGVLHQCPRVSATKDFKRD